jgi:type III secretory pathway component EscU
MCRIFFIFRTGYEDIWVTAYVLLAAYGPYGNVIYHTMHAIACGFVKCTLVLVCEIMRTDIIIFFKKFGFISIKDYNFRYISLSSHLHMDSHESMMCEINGIYIKL